MDDDDNDDDNDEYDDDERVTEVHIVLCGPSTASICTCRHSVGFIHSRFVIRCLTAKDCGEDDIMTNARFSFLRNILLKVGSQTEIYV